MSVPQIALDLQPEPVKSPPVIPSPRSAPAPHRPPASASVQQQTPAWQRSLWATGAAALFVLLALQIALSAWYTGRIYPGVKVAAVSLGNLNRLQARDTLRASVRDRQLALKVAGKDYRVMPTEVGAEYDLNTTLDQAFLQGRKQWFAPLAIWQTMHQPRLNYAFTVDSHVQGKFIDRLVGTSGQAPVDATIVVVNGEPTVQPDANGRAIAASEIAAAIAQQVADTTQPTPALEPSVQKARIQAKDVVPAIAETKQLLATPVTITYQGRVFRPAAAQMSDWLVFDKSPPDQPAGLIPKVSPDGIKHYLQSVALQINVNPTNKKIRVENGVSTELQAGANGLQLDQDSLAAKIADAVKQKQAITAEATTKTVPFQTEYNRVITLDYGKYIEVNLKLQHMWVYQDHQVIFESPVTSGATGAGFPTVTGLFSIQAKQTNRNLNGYAIGYNYNVFVKYWMPFYGNYGLHDASWRSSFGGPDYYYGGSHGCVNMPEASAAFLYGWADVGTPVWVHN